MRIMHDILFSTRCQRLRSQGLEIVEYCHIIVDAKSHNSQIRIWWYFTEVICLMPSCAWFMFRVNTHISSLWDVDLLICLFNRSMVNVPEARDSQILQTLNLQSLLQQFKDISQNRWVPRLVVHGLCLGSIGQGHINHFLPLLHEYRYINFLLLW